MKQWRKLIALIGAVLILCVCVGLAVYVRMSWCRVTFVCEEGCAHKAWCRVGEVADTSVVTKAHQEEKTDKQIAGIYKDEKRLINYLSEPLCKTKTTLYVGEWKNMDMHDIWFFTPYGTIVMYVDLWDCTGNVAQNIAKMEAYFRDAFTALGGDADAIDEAYHFQFVRSANFVDDTTRPLFYIMEAIHGLYVGPIGGECLMLTYPYIRMIKDAT